jgi:phage terminase small subunit
MPPRSKFLWGIGRKEWNRVAQPLFSKARLQQRGAVLLESYCYFYGQFAAVTQELSRCDPTEYDTIRLLKSQQRKYLKDCRESALCFGFPVDSTGRMNLEKPMSLTAAANILGAIRERRDKRLRDRYHVASLPEWLQAPTYFIESQCKEWVRVAPALYGKNRLSSDEDQARLVFYCNVFNVWRVSFRALKDFRRGADSMTPEQRTIFKSLSNEVERSLALCKKFAWELGSSFEVPKGLNMKMISKRAQRK